MPGFETSDLRLSGFETTLGILAVTEVKSPSLDSPLVVSLDHNFLPIS